MLKVFEVSYLSPFAGHVRTIYPSVLEFFLQAEIQIVFYSRHQITCFKVTAKSYNVATRTAEPRRVKTAQNL
jgi:hypothetical protein